MPEVGLPITANENGPKVFAHPGPDQNPNRQEEAQIMTHAIPNPIIGLNAACSEPGCASVPELHGPSERGVAPVSEVHTVADVEDIEGRFRVGGMRSENDPWALTVQVEYALTPAQGNRLARAVLATTAKLAILERARGSRGAGE